MQNEPSAFSTHLVHSDAHKASTYRFALRQVRLKRGRPQKHKDVHRALKAGLNDAQQQNFLVGGHQAPGSAEVLADLGCNAQ